MKKKFSKKDYILVLLAIGLLISTYSVEILKVKEKDKWYEEKLEASILMKRAVQTIKEEKIDLGFEIDKEFDINETGIIGYEISGITTTLGSLESKRTSSNPNFAAVVSDMLKEAKIEKGDHVAVNFSSSFPALNIAVLSALQVLDIHPVAISSIGSSTWGANIPYLTYPDMEEILYNKGILKNKSVAVSLGGAEDIGLDLDQQIVPEIINRIKKYNRKFIYEKNLSENIQARYNIYLENVPEIKAFINVGGNIVSMGSGTEIIDINPGLIMNRKVKQDNDSGLIQIFLSKKIPVIHLLNIKEIAVKYGLPIDPQPLPDIGQGDVYFQEKYPKALVFFLLVITILVTIFYRKRVKSEYDE